VKQRRASTGILALGSLGVVFGDIGTSPLYAFGEIFLGAHDIPATTERVLGALSLVFWTLTVIVSLKYVLIVMRADNEGEGGIMSLASLATAVVRRARSATIIMVFGVLGASLFYGDGVITPAISVLSAVEGLELVAPGLQAFVVPIALVLLVGLFSIQRFGTHRVGAVFGPIMLVWFAVIGVLGLLSVVQSPEVFASLSPTYAVQFMMSDPWTAFLALGSVVLCVTGAEALYADMGQFGRRPIRLSWFVIASPALYLNYLGQGALVLRDPSAVDNPFYLLVPAALQLPMVLLATAATLIASQAVITGAFSMTQQAIRLGYLPRMTVVHTSATERGQVYVPFVNLLLAVAVVGLVVGFQSSSNLASAYGIAVTGTFVITTCLIAVVARRRWRLPLWIVVPGLGIFLVIDGSFFAANLTKFAHGGWFPLVAATLIFVVLASWRVGLTRLGQVLDDRVLPLSDITTAIHAPGVVRTEGTTVYITTEEGAPYALIRQTRLLGVVSSSIVILRMRTTETPWVDPPDRLTVSEVADGVLDAVLLSGYMERADPAGTVELIASRYPQVDALHCRYTFYTVHSEVALTGPVRWLSREIFAFMQRNATGEQRYYHLPPERVMELGRVVAL
jgi:KUP system potassium uptake protein